ncbi:succinyl-diaminopimelate desuccinylase [Rubritepida flocculans]|uniref:succinyl-diaminopimelate desuccinylase n=1 Tax=Rubritepida flocculans TaxID=182403 RepID=UPI00041356ED|nr:succinyl-diaminopimelate desuccinylase [Rubritepida flocculans]
MTDPLAPTDPIPLAQALIRCPSVTPADHGALDVVQRFLESLGFACERLVFGPEEWRVDNLWARRGSGSPHFMYCGHTDVVPPGDPSQWTDDPFAGVVREGWLYGRGANDMKGGVAAFLAGLKDYLAAHPDHPGSISLLITGDEEARSVDGVARVMPWLAERGLLPDMALVGEPSSFARVGDVIRIGRRGSLTARIAVHGKQGHSALPQKADNPVHRLMAALAPLIAAPLDQGTEFFPPSTLQVTGFDVGNRAANVIPATARAMLNIRFNDLHTRESLTERLHAALRAAGCRYDIEIESNAAPFLTEPGPFVEALIRAIRRTTGEEPELNAGGGTSDARFIRAYCPVAEFGDVGATGHQVDERASVENLRTLAGVYRAILEECLG